MSACYLVICDLFQLNKVCAAVNILEILIQKLLLAVTVLKAYVKTGSSLTGRLSGIVAASSHPFRIISLKYQNNLPKIPR